VQRFQRKLALGKHLAQQQDRQQDIGLLETGDNMHVLMRNGKVQENSAWAYVKLKDDQHRLALKLSTSDKPNDFRYYGSKRKASVPPRTPPPAPSVPFEEEAYQCRDCQANLCVEYDHPSEYCLYCRDRRDRAQNYCRCCGRTISDDATEDLCYACFGLAKPEQGEYGGFQ